MGIKPNPLLTPKAWAESVHLPCINCRKDEACANIALALPVKQLGPYRRWEKSFKQRRKRGAAYLFAGLQRQASKGQSPICQLWKSLEVASIRQAVEWSRRPGGAFITPVHENADASACSSSYGLVREAARPPRLYRGRQPLNGLIHNSMAGRDVPGERSFIAGETWQQIRGCAANTFA